jgi:metallophosphoesterase (TIGR00282 family)
MKILVIGDIVGRPGRQIIHELLHGMRRQYTLDLVIANGENAAGGFGLTLKTTRELLRNGVDIITSGNHIWAQKDIIPHLDDEEIPVIRPLNYPKGAPGRGYLISGQVMVVNLIGRTFMNSYDCPFRAMDALLEERTDKPPVIIVDFHAEATSEKMAMGRYLDGRVSAVLGTHTHVGTIDTQILRGGTAYVTDIGMAGPTDSIIGDEPKAVMARFLTLMPHALSVGKGEPMLNAILLEIDAASGKATGIERITRETSG